MRNTTLLTLIVGNGFNLREKTLVLSLRGVIDEVECIRDPVCGAISNLLHSGRCCSWCRYTYRPAGGCRITQEKSLRARIGEAISRLAPMNKALLSRILRCMHYSIPTAETVMGTFKEYLSIFSLLVYRFAFSKYLTY